jgi:HNH endonuclease
MTQLREVIEAFPTFGQFEPGGVIARRAGALLRARGSQANRPEQNAWQIIENNCPDYKQYKGRALFRMNDNRNLGLVHPREQIYIIARETPYASAGQGDTDLWSAIERDVVLAGDATVSHRTRREIDRDLSNAALEGLPEERRQLVRSRAAWLAERFVKKRQKAGTLTCDGDGCKFDPVQRVAGAKVQPRSLMDVHHRNSIAEGTRLTTLEDFALLCPTCHRWEHALQRASQR